MQRIFNVDKWFEVQDGKALHFGNPLPRFVRLDVNSVGPCRVFYADGNGDLMFLAQVDGRDVIEFRSYGEFSLHVEGSALWMYTIDGEDISFSIPDAVKLTKLSERRARNPEIEFMQYQMNRNIQERMNAVRDEMARVFDQRVAAIEAAAKKPETSSSDLGVSAKPAPDKPADAGKPDQPADGGTGEPA